MKFLKYLFFLLLILITGALLFFATKDGKFEVAESRVIDAPAEVVFNFINDYKNWEKFGSWMEDETLKINYPQITSGVGASYSWNSEKDGKGAMQTLAVEPYEKIVQKIVFNGPLQDDGYEVTWKFEPEESDQKTKVTWSIKGELGLFEKMFFTVYGLDMNAMLSEMYVESLTNLEEAIAVELENYSVEVEGLAIHPGGFYIYNTISTSLEQLDDTISQLLNSMNIFMNENGLTASGPYFVVYKEWDETLAKTLISVGIPTSDFVALPETSPVSSGYLPETVSVKAVLKGHHSKLPAAREEAKDFINRQGYQINESLAPFNVFVVTGKEDPNPANWVTEVYIPIEHINESHQEL
jgi:ribosome-associated toxin RatA of RatAB toxin-antitoxin module